MVVGPRVRVSGICAVPAAVRLRGRACRRNTDMKPATVLSSTALFTVGFVGPARARASAPYALSARWRQTLATGLHDHGRYRCRCEQTKNRDLAGGIRRPAFALGR